MSSRKVDTEFTVVFKSVVLSVGAAGRVRGRQRILLLRDLKKMSRKGPTVYLLLLLFWGLVSTADGRNLSFTSRGDVDFILSDWNRAWKFVICISHFKSSCSMEGRHLIAVVRSIKQHGGACVLPCTQQDKEIYDYFMDRLKMNLLLYEQIKNEV
ncbi:hypothetical protein FHG87_008533 [Trinorchestia longiramus]|nr:hypothetical protein FHG87_008533 [Trinorchestia longiramus]